MMNTLTEEVETELSKTSEIADQVVPVMAKLVEKISPAISTLSDKLGTTAEHLWTILVTQVYNQTVGNAIILVFTFITLYGIFYCTKGWKDNDASITFKICGCTIAIIVSCINIINMVQKLINPEYYALRTIMNFIK